MKITVQERMRRLLEVFYEDLLTKCNLGEEDLADNICLLDAVRDCITGKEENMDEWSISKTGVIRFK